MKPLVSMIIVNFNGSNFLKECFDSILKQKYKNIEIIMVDNGSIDNSVKFTENNYPTIKIIKNKKNGGYAEGNNIGIKKSKGKYILLLNNDTKVTIDFLSPLVEVMEKNSNIGAAQSKIYLMDYKNILDTTIQSLNILGFQNYKMAELDRIKNNKIEESFFVKGACMMVRSDLIKKIGMFDEDFYLYNEESDLCWRIWLYGFRIVFVPKSIIYHKVGGTSIFMTNYFLTFHSCKNRICMLIKNLSFSRLIIILPLNLFVYFSMSFVYLVVLKPSNSLAILKGIAWNIKNLKKTLRKRTKIQRSRVISDGKLLHKFLKPANFEKLYKYFMFNLKRKIKI